MKKTHENDVCEQEIERKIQRKKTVIFFCCRQNDKNCLTYNIFVYSLSLSHVARNEFILNSVCVFSLLIHFPCKIQCTYEPLCVWNKLKCNCLNWKRRPKFEYFHSNSDFVEWQHKRKEIMLLTKWKIFNFLFSALCMRPKWIDFIYCCCGCANAVSCPLDYEVIWPTTIEFHHAYLPCLPLNQPNTYIYHSFFCFLSLYYIPYHIIL